MELTLGYDEGPIHVDGTWKLEPSGNAFRARGPATATGASGTAGGPTRRPPGASPPTSRASGSPTSA